MIIAFIALTRKKLLEALSQPGLKTYLKEEHRIHITFYNLILKIVEKKQTILCYQCLQIPTPEELWRNRESSGLP